MRLLLLPALLMLPVFAMEQGDSITLDPDEMESMKQWVFGGAAVRELTPQEKESIAARLDRATKEEQRWLTAMESEDDVRSVLLLALLQQLNPRLPMEKYPRLYADALVLHRSAAAGEPMAVAHLEAALRGGALPGGLSYLRSEHLVAHLGRIVEEKSRVNSK